MDDHSAHHDHGHHGHDQHHWNERYASAERLFNIEPDESLVELVSTLSPGRAVDLGAGEGRNSLWLATKKWKVTAVDHSDVAIGRLAESAQVAGVEVDAVVSDILSFLAQGGQFDLVVLAYIQWASEERSKLLAEASAAVAPGGHLFLVGHHLDSLGHGGPSQPERLYTEESLKGAFPGLRIIELERRESASGDIGVHGVDVIVWAERPQG